MPHAHASLPVCLSTDKSADRDKTQGDPRRWHAKAPHPLFLSLKGRGETCCAKTQVLRLYIHPHFPTAYWLFAIAYRHCFQNIHQLHAFADERFEELGEEDAAGGGDDIVGEAVEGALYLAGLEGVVGDAVVQGGAFLAVGFVDIPLPLLKPVTVSSDTRKCSLSRRT